MPRTMRVEIDSAGNIHQLGSDERLPAGPAILSWSTPGEDDNLMSISERSLAVDWLRPEEDAAWAHLQREK